MKLIVLISFLFILFATMLLSKSKYKEPEFLLLKQENNIEIRQYKEYVIAKTARSLDQVEPDNSMFRVLASYIFGRNEKNQNIPMTAPVTTYQDNNLSHMLFYMLDSDEIKDLPKPSGQDITFEKFNLNKCAVIRFSWFVNQKKINKYQAQLEKFIQDNGYTKESSYMINRYDSPWTLPFIRRNEILIKIK